MIIYRLSILYFIHGNYYSIMEFEEKIELD